MRRAAQWAFLIWLVAQSMVVVAQVPAGQSQGGEQPSMTTQPPPAAEGAAAGEGQAPVSVPGSSGLPAAASGNGSEVILPPTNLKAVDTPGDDGSSVSLTWDLSPTNDITGYEVSMQDVTAGGEIQDVIRLRPRTKDYRDSDASRERIISGHQYHYFIKAIKGEAASMPAASNVVTPESDWFKSDASSYMVFIWMVVICIAFAIFIFQGRKGKIFYIRPIAGIQNVDEAIGRATEMGRPILYVLGIGYIDYIATIASLTILGRVAKKAAEFDTPILVPCNDYVVYPVAQEIVKAAYSDAGRPDAFKPNSVYYVTSAQFAYVSNVCGTMQRDLPATNFFIGHFKAESLILAEAGASTGAIQIAGTDCDDQLPFFITSCDYTLIGEELYAASAYLAKEPVLLGTLKGQDFGKAMILAALIIGSLLVLLKITFFLDWFPVA